MANSPEKLLYSRRATAEVLSLSIRSVDYLITSGRLSARRVGGKILIPVIAIRRFARQDHPELVRVKVRQPFKPKAAGNEVCALPSRFEPVRERLEGEHVSEPKRRA
jgi:hypothetical protein